MTISLAQDSIQDFGSLRYSGVDQLKVSASGVQVANATTAQNPVTYAQSFGIGQTWVDALPSRQAGVVYTNTSLSPIKVAVVVTTAVNKELKMSMTIDDVVVNAVDFGGIASVTTKYTISEVVPPGKTYKVDVTSTGFSLSSWLELK